MHRIITPFVCALAMATACSSPVGETSDEPFPPVKIDARETEQTIAVLREMSEFIASLEAFRFEAEIQYDAVQASGQKIEFGSHRKIALRRPDRVRVEAVHWDGEHELITFDGKRLSATIPTQHVYASMEYTGTIGEALEHLITEYGVAAPLSDLLRRDLADDIAERVISARRLGVVTIAGQRCRHLAFHGERIDFQLYIKEGDQPVPVRFVIDYHAELGVPQFRAQLHDFDWNPTLGNAIFRFVPQPGAQRVEFGELLELLLGPEADSP